MQMKPKLFIGPKIRDLRERRPWTLQVCARQLGLSVSYLSQIETNQRPLSARAMMAVMEVFGVDASELQGTDEQRLTADLREACAAGAGGEQVPLSEIKQIAMRAPRFAREYLDLHRAYRQADDRLKLADEAVALGESATSSSLLPYEEVRDFFHYKDNYIHALDIEAEALADRVLIPGGVALESGLQAMLASELKVTVVRASHDTLMRAYNPARRTLLLNAAQPAETRAFQMAFHLVSEVLGPTIEMILNGAGLRSPQATDVCRVGLANYAAGALVMPYRRFLHEARRLRHDVEQLSLLFGVSVEQVCHRLSTLQRPGERGVPLYFLRMDRAGNITKRHSATRFHFARFGGTCPLWNVHEAFSAPDRFLVQVAEMPDGARYLSVARSILKPSGSFTLPSRRYVLGFGCEMEHAKALVYSDAVEARAMPTPIGVSCRICERLNCAQRAFPPMDRQIQVSRAERHVVPFSIEPLGP